MKPNTQTNPPLFSEFAGDADMMGLVELFIEEMSDRISQLERSWSDSSYEDLRVISHQLKGAGGGYGFSLITEAAGALEQELKQGCTDKASLETPFNDLLSLCKRASI